MIEKRFAVSIPFHVADQNNSVVRKTENKQQL